MTKLLLIATFILGFLHPASFIVAAVLFYFIYKESFEKLRQDTIPTMPHSDDFDINIETDSSNPLLKHVRIIPSDGLKIHSARYDNDLLKDKFISLSSLAFDDNSNIFFDILLTEDNMQVTIIRMIKENEQEQYCLEIEYKSTID